MKAKKYIRAAVAVAVALGAAACDENAWNDHLNGFDKIEDQPVADVQTVEYTLASADYSTIAGLEANKTIAGEDGAAALAAVGSLKSFSAEAPASLYVPAFLSTSGFPYFTLTQGSAVKLTYNKRVAGSRSTDSQSRRRLLYGIRMGKRGKLRGRLRSLPPRSRISAGIPHRRSRSQRRHICNRFLQAGSPGALVRWRRQHPFGTR